MEISSKRLRYTYAPLADPEKSIRLLSVIDANEVGGIFCSLREITNIDTASYACLSYTWGDPFGREATYPKVTIICNGATLDITYNLSNALIHLWRTQKKNLTSIWIDAICINQDDLPERGAQVSVMNKIYSCAECVISWLGPEPDIDPGMNKVHELLQYITAQNEIDPGWQDTRTSGFVVTDFPKREAFNEVTTSHWLAARDLLYRSYFRRTWIVQEVLCAKSLIMVCGGSTLLWDDLRDLLNALETFGRQEVATGQQVFELSASKSVSVWILLHLRAQKDFQDAKLMIVSNREHFKCSDRRDAIYGYIGFSTEVSIKPDYTKPVQQVYTEYWSRLLEVGNVKKKGENLNTLDFLTAVEDQSISSLRKPAGGCIALPSWVPDFSDAHAPGSISQKYDGYDEFNASICMKGNRIPICDSSLGRLVLYGYCLDSKIEDLSESDDHSIEELTDPPSVVNLLKLILRGLEVAKTPYSTRQETLCAVWSSLSIRIPGKPLFPIPDEHQNHLKIFLLVMLSGHVRNRTEQEEQILQSCYELDDSDLIPSLDDVKQFAELFDYHMEPSVQKRPKSEPFDVGFRDVVFNEHCLWYTRIFRSSEGWIGKGFLSMEAGDQIWLVPGARVFYILRPVGRGTFKFIGHAYVHGMMTGGAAARFHESDLQELIIE